MPLTFDIVSRLMVVAAIAVVALPMIRNANGARVWPGVAIAALFIYLGSAVVYPMLSNWTWSSDTRSAGTDVAGTDDLLNRLHAQATADPDNAEPWLALGSALMQAQRPGDAVAALERVQQLTRGSNPDSTLLLIDALMMSDASASARGRVSTLVEQLLQVAPEHPKALFYGAELALARRDLGLARERMSRLLKRAEADSSAEAERVRGVLKERIALIDAQVGAPAPAAPAAGGPSLTLDVSLDSALADNVAATDVVFVLARDGAGPPVAVKRLSVAELPARVILDDTDAMLPSRKLSGFDSVEVVARVAKGGTPVAQSGDIFGRARVATNRSEPLALVMAQVEP